MYHVQLLVETGFSEPWVALEIRVSQPPRSASQNLSRKRLLKEIFARNQASALERATRSKLRRKECIGIPCLPSESDGNHPHSSSSSSSACTPTSDNEARPNFQNDLDYRDATIDQFCADLTREQTIDAHETYELLLTLGVDVGVARTTVAGLLSPHIFAGVQHVSEDVLDLRSQGCGKMWDLHNAAEKVKVRKKVASAKPYIVIGSCLDRW